MGVETSWDYKRKKAANNVKTFEKVDCEGLDTCHYRICIYHRVGVAESDDA